MMPSKTSAGNKLSLSGRYPGNIAPCTIRCYHSSTLNQPAGQVTTRTGKQSTAVNHTFTESLTFY